MQEITLFEIPVYSMSKSKYEKLTEEYYEEILNKNKNKAADIQSYKEGARIESRIKYYPWKFNRIIGYIEITMSKNDLYFYRYEINVSKLVVDTKKKHCLYLRDEVNNHVRIVDKSNAEIVEIIDNYLDSINKNFQNRRKSWVLDLGMYNTVKNHMDFNAIKVDKLK